MSCRWTMYSTYRPTTIPLCLPFFFFCFMCRAWSRVNRVHTVHYIALAGKYRVYAIESESNIYRKIWKVVEKYKITNGNEPINSILQRINVVRIVLLKTHFMKPSFLHYSASIWKVWQLKFVLFSLVVWMTCNWYTINGWLLNVFEYF